MIGVGLSRHSVITEVELEAWLLPVYVDHNMLTKTRLGAFGMCVSRLRVSPLILDGKDLSRLCCPCQSSFA